MYCTCSQKIDLATITGGNQLEDGDESGEERIPAGLASWRGATLTAVTGHQLMVCVVQLNKSVAWEKSIMKVVSLLQTNIGLNSEV